MTAGRQFLSFQTLFVNHETKILKLHFQLSQIRDLTYVLINWFYVLKPIIANKSAKHLIIIAVCLKTRNRCWANKDRKPYQQLFETCSNEYLLEYCTEPQVAVYSIEIQEMLALMTSLRQESTLLAFCPRRDTPISISNSSVPPKITIN